MTGQNYSLLFFCSLRDLSPFSSLAINSSTLGVKQQPPLHTKVFLALSQDSLLVFRKTGGVVMEGEELVDLIVLGVHDNAALHRSNLPPSQIGNRVCHLGDACARGDIIHWRGHYSLVNNVRGDIIHSDIGTNSVEKAGRSVFFVNILMAVPKLYGAVTVFQRGESRWWLFTLKGHPIEDCST